MVLYITGSHGRITPNNLPLQQSLESTSTNASDTMSTGNINEVAHIYADMYLQFLTQSSTLTHLICHQILLL